MLKIFDGELGNYIIRSTLPHKYRKKILGDSQSSWICLKISLQDVVVFQNVFIQFSPQSLDRCFFKCYIYITKNIEQQISVVELPEEK